ncbi:MAG: hypothetical protein M5U28_43885 [Sandaracinaceae bacterium]|nr:hypothetical protein [Sandaracinaceae bacterium]
MSRTVSAIRLGLVSSATALTLLFAWLAHDAIEGRATSLAAPFMPSMDMALAVRVDALAALFAILVCGIGALVAAYSASYVHHAPGRFYLHLTLFFAAMLGLVLADDLLLLYVCWELTSVSSFFPRRLPPRATRGAGRRAPRAPRDGARRALPLRGLGHAGRGGRQLPHLGADRAGRPARSHPLHAGADPRGARRLHESPRRCPSTPGSRARWRRPPLRAPICTPPPW